MTVQTLSWVLEHSEARLGARLVLIALANHAHIDGGSAYPSQETIAREARLTARQVRRCLIELEAAGSICRAGTTANGVVIWRLEMSGDNMSGDIYGAEVGQIGPLGRTNPADSVSDMSDKPSVNQRQPGETRASARDHGSLLDSKVIESC